MKKKFKGIVLGVAMGIFGVLSAVGLSGCGTKLSTLKENYTAMQTKIGGYSEVFTGGQIDGVGITYSTLKVSYGTYVDEKIGDGLDDDFDELESKYNAILVISNDYITQNISYIQNYNEKKFSKAAKKALKSLCKDIDEFTDYLPTFVAERNALAKYFEQMGDGNERQTQTKLVTFKKSYGTLVSKNLDISMSLASCIEGTEIYDSLQKTEVTPTSLKIVKEYTRAKMLPLFSRFMLTEISNQFNWNNYKTQSESLIEIDNLLTELNSFFNNEYMTTFVSNSSPTTLKKGTMEELFDMVDEFFVEAESYYDALSDLEIREFAVSYEGDMQSYLNKNQLAERDLHKMEQFIEITMPNFVNEFTTRI